MPIYMEISPLHRLVTIVARGSVSGDEVRGAAQKLAEARVRYPVGAVAGQKENRAR